MFTAEIRFRVLRKAGGDAVSDAVSGLIESWHRNGQALSDEWPIVADPKMVRAFVSIPERTALRRGLANKWILEKLGRLGQAGLSRPSISILGREPATADVCRCKKSSALILYTDYGTTESPLRCADCFRPVPLYRISHTSGWDSYEDIIFWRRNYQRCDGLQMACRVGERFCTEQMSSLTSALSKQGLACCRKIADVTARPCYYYLYRYYGRGKQREAKRKCPSCGRSWRLQHKWHDKFDFRCNRCHLLSNFAYSVY